MAVGSLKNRYDDLEERIISLEIKYIDPHLSPTEPLASYSMDVQSFAILCHAAFEEHLEDICNTVSDEVIDKIDSSQRISISTICLLHFYPHRLSLDDKSWLDTDLIRKKFQTIIHEAVVKYQKDVENNNGVGMKYLKKMLIPIGLDLPSSVKERSSLATLANYRGGFAHSYSNKATTIPAPKSVRDIVYDVLDLMKELTNDSISIPYYKF